MKLHEIVTVAKYLFLSRFDKSLLAQRLEREREIMRVVAILPMKYSCRQVERALKTAKATPEMIYISLATGEHTLVLELFYASLRVQVERERLHANEDDWREDEWW